MNTQSILKPNRFSIAMLIVLELTLTAAAAFSLFQLAEPMTRSGLALGLGRRYVVAEKEAKVALSDVDKLDDLLPLNPLQATLEPKHQRAQNLNLHAGLLLAGNALLGWLALWVARRQHIGAAWVCASLWFMGAMALSPWGLPSWFYGVLAALCAVFYLVDGIVYRWTGTCQARITTGVFNSHWFVLGWPGWVFLTGTGLLFVMDFAARGPVSIQYIGLYQVDALWLACFLLCLSAMWRNRFLTGAAAMITGLSQLLMRKRGPFLLVTIGVTLVLAIGWVGRPIHAELLPGWGKPYFSGELLRAMFGIAAAWCLYRVGEWEASRKHILSVMVSLGLILLMVMVGLFTSKDGGPALVISLALCLSLGTPFLHRFIASHARLGVLAVTLLVLVGGCAWSFGLQEVIPALSQRASVRAAAIHAPYRAASPYLAQVRWLADAAPASGFGLGRTPWCGAKAHVEAIACTKSTGAPLQMPSDYAAAGLTALYGLPGAAALLLALLAWLASLSWPGLAVWHSGRTPSWSLLQSELVIAFSLLAVAQSLITVAGSFGQIPLTGITLPLLGYGGVAICFTAVWIGLALNPAGACTHH